MAAASRWSGKGKRVTRQKERAVQREWLLVLRLLFPVRKDFTCFAGIGAGYKIFADDKISVRQRGLGNRALGVAVAAAEWTVAG